MEKLIAKDRYKHADMSVDFIKNIFIIFYFEDDDIERELYLSKEQAIQLMNYIKRNL